MECHLDLDFEHYTIAWIAPLEIEAQAAWHMLDHVHQGNFSMNRGDDYVYTAGDINGHNVIIATLPADHDYGVGSAAALASQVKKSFPNLWFGLLVGVAAGLPNLSCTPPRDIRLGDVLVGVGEGDNAGLVSYGLGKETLDGSQLLRGGAQVRTEAVVRSAIGSIKSLAPMQGNIFLQYYKNIENKMHANGTFVDPGQEKDQLFQVVTKGDILVTQLVARTLRHASERTKVWYGHIGSGDKLMKNAQKRDELRDKFNLIGLEMEAAGIMNIIPVGVIRGVCDYGDAQKNKEWQPYAAAIAAAYAKALLYKIRPMEKRREKALQLQSAIAEREANKIACLLSLSFTNIDDRLHDITLAHQETCEWLFTTAKFQQWQNRDNLQSHNGVFWIKGKPGAGKSTLMKHAFLYCQKVFKDHIIAAYFFNARGNKLEKTPLGMLKSLLHQLLTQDPLLCEGLIPMYLDKQKKHAGAWEWKVGELKSFLLSTVMLQSKPLFIFIDALDECNESDVREVISFIEALSKKAVSLKKVLNICLSSRHYPNVNIRMCLELVVEEQKEHSQDIVKYVQHKLMTRDKKVEGELLRKAQHVFLWVVLVVEMLNQAFDHGKIRAMQKKLYEVPSDLDEVFWTLLGKDNPDKQDTIYILQWVLFAGRLLKPEELYFAVLAGTETEELGAWDRSKETSETIKRFITSTSKGLIEVRKGETETVQFIHESINDFLLRNRRLQVLDPSLKLDAVSVSHDRLMASCMSYVLMKDLQPLVKFWANIKELAFDYPFLEYSSTYILYHAEEALKGCAAQQALVQRVNQLDWNFKQLRSFHDSFESNTQLRYGKDVDLLYAVSLHGYYELAKAVLPNKGNLNMQGGYYHCALRAALAAGEIAVVLLLLEKGADVNLQRGYYGTALQEASYRGSTAFVRLLLENGANANAQGGYFGNALQAASCAGHDAIVALLLENGADIDAPGGFYGNALQEASYRGNKAVVELLLEKGAKVNVPGGYYGNALQAASYAKHEAIIALLLENGAKTQPLSRCCGKAALAASHKGLEDTTDNLSSATSSEGNEESAGNSPSEAIRALQRNRH